MTMAPDPLKPTLASDPPPCRRALVVEDDPDVFHLVMLAIQTLDPRFVVERVTDVEAARKALTLHPYDLVLADYILEGAVPGLALREAVGEIQPRAGFAMMSSLPLGEHLALSGDGGLRVLRKPFSLQRCQEFLRTLL